jgi:hypothetical protein
MRTGISLPSSVVEPKLESTWLGMGGTPIGDELLEWPPGGRVSIRLDPAARSGLAA